jgi:UDP-N-acetylglucosamine:LPS N-acetylglucosamine transferase
VAQALARELAQARSEQVAVWVDDLYRSLASPPARRFPGAYALMTRHCPALWRKVYDWTNRPPGPTRFELLGDPIGGRGLGRLLNGRRPHVVVSVLPGINGFVARSIRRTGVESLLAVVVTDWADIHLGWMAQGVDTYFVPTSAAAAECGRAGVSADRVTVAGYVVRPEFAISEPGDATRAAARGKLNLPLDRFVILAMVGTEGTKRALEHLMALRDVGGLDAELIVLCGRDERLQRRLLADGWGQIARVHGYVDDVASLMHAADLLVTKPGGATLAEAFAARLPVIMYAPLPGQEEGNARFMISQSAALLATSPTDLARLVMELRWNSDRRGRLARSGAALHRPDAAATISRSLVEIATRSAGPRHADARERRPASR